MMILSVEEIRFAAGAFPIGLSRPMPIMMGFNFPTRPFSTAWLVGWNAVKGCWEPICRTTCLAHAFGHKGFCEGEA